jgi:5-methyltetrahydropteroyltriglutamate--homocysteine methyltransferase
MPTQYRADHVGSFLRPPELLQARQVATNNSAALHAIEDRQIDRVLAKQKELGFEIFTDGEFRRRNFMSDFTDAVEGFDLGESIRADNACFEAARRPGVTLAMHLCRGNNRSHWYAEGGYDAIAEKLFTTMAVHRFLLEYDDERSGTFEPLRLVPRDKTVVLGLISSRKAQLEKADDIARRIDEASRYFPTENLALSPQCGFASTMEGNLLTEDEQWSKLRLVADVARQVWS